MFQVILNDDTRRELVGRTDDQSIAIGAAQWLAHCGHRVIIRGWIGSRDMVYGHN